MANNTQITGYHGTAYDNVGAIRARGFKRSTKSYEWLGYGVYFFIEGISDPIEAAREWATLHSVRGGVKRYRQYAIISAEISPHELVDLTKREQLGEFNRLRDKIIERYSENFSRKPPVEHDRLVFNFAREELGCDAVIANLYIQNNQQSSMGIDSRVPNTTVLVVAKVEIIGTNTINLVEEGEC